MAANHGKSGRLYIDVSTNASGSASAVTLLRSWDLQQSVDRVEVTAFGDSNKTYVQGLPDSQLTFDGFYDDATSDVFQIPNVGARKFYLYPNTGTTTKYWFGTMLFDVSTSGAVDSAVAISGSGAAASAVIRVG
jgi:hypothetical protein